MKTTVSHDCDGSVTITVTPEPDDDIEPQPVRHIHHAPGFTVCGGWWRDEAVATHVLPGIHPVTWREGRSWSIPVEAAPDEDTAKEWAVAQMETGQRERASA